MGTTDDGGGIAQPGNNDGDAFLQGHFDEFLGFPGVALRTFVRRLDPAEQDVHAKRLVRTFSDDLNLVA